MAFSFKKLYKNEEVAKAEEQAAQNAELFEEVKSEADKQEAGKSKPKHGDPGVCCGGCS